MGHLKIKLNDVNAYNREMSIKLTKDSVSFITSDGNIELDISSIVKDYNVYQCAGEKTKIDISLSDDISIIKNMDFENVINLRNEFDKIIKKRNLEML